MSRGSMLGPFKRALALGAALVVLAQVAPGSAKTTVEQIRRAERKVKQIRRELRREQARLRAIQGQIHTLNTQVAQALAHLHQLRNRTRAVDNQIARQTEAIDELQVRLDERARAAYITGPAAVVDAVLGAESLTDMSDRLTFLDVLARQDSDVSIAIDLEREQLREHEVDLKDYASEEKDVLRDLARQTNALEKQFAAQVRVEDRIADKLAAAKKHLNVLQEQRRRELAAALGVGNIGPPLSADGPFFWCPVDAPRSYIDDWGFPRSGGRTHQGNDIFAPTGTPIRSPFDGRADEGSGGLGGIYVFVYSDAGDHVYNAHMSRFAGVDGQRVTKGQVIGYVGNSGNAVGTPPHNHFGYYPGNGAAVNPYPYLNEVCGDGGRGF